MSTEKFSQDPTRFSRLSAWLLERTGGSFLGIVIFLIEIISFPIAALSLPAIQANAHFSADQLTGTALWASILISIGDILLLGSMYFLTRDARHRLDRWAQHKPLPGGKVELDAWHQITSIWWRYAVSLIFVFLLITIALNTIQHFGLGATTEQLVYTFFGGMISAIIITLITTPILEAILRPTLVILLPETIEVQTSLAGFFGLQAKLLGIILALLVASILLIAPIGYQTTTLAFNKVNDSSQVLRDLQIELIIASVAILVIGILLSLMLTRQIFRPLYELMKVFDRVEKGDLKQRANITSFTAFEELGKLATSFNVMVSQLDSSQQALERSITDRTEQLHASNEVGKIASTILDPDLLVTQTVNLIANTFSYYFVAIFLITDDRWAELKDATGTTGEILKENRHRVPIGGNNIIGASVMKKEAQIALDVGEGAKIIYNPLLPYTRSELALPLIVGERVIGVLDVQSTREADFNPDDISTLQGMANQVAIAIENARLFKEMDQTLDELRQANRQYVVSSWTDKLKGEKLEFSNVTSISAKGEEGQEIEIGLNLRDQNIGHIRLETNNEWTQEDQGWVESLATQVAISLENARLIEESQGSALRERLSASIVQKIWASTTSIDTILQTAVRELGRALEASEATIELKIEEKRK
jgi:GAF domain-containing protein/HAMP domain-containing protein